MLFPLEIWLARLCHNFNKTSGKLYFKKSPISNYLCNIVQTILKIGPIKITLILVIIQKKQFLE